MQRDRRGQLLSSQLASHLVSKQPARIYLIRVHSESHVSDSGDDLVAGTRRRKVGGARPGAGRPPKPIHIKQRHRIAITLTDSEMEELERRAGDEWLGGYCRKVVVRHLMRRSK